MNKFPMVETELWTMQRHGRRAAAAIRQYSFGRELRISVSGLVVFKRMVKPHETLSDVRTATEKVFLEDGWTRS